MSLLAYSQYTTPTKILVRENGGASWKNLDNGGIYGGSGDLSESVDIRQGNYNLEYTNTGGDVLFDTTTLVISTSENRIGIGTLSPVSKMDINGSVSFPIEHISGNIVLDESHHTVFPSGQSPPNIVLPNPDFCRGRMYRIVRVLSGSGTISEFISSSGAYTYTYSQGVLLLQSDGFDWRQINLKPVIRLFYLKFNWPQSTS